jgi:BAI1-associated protein 3
MSEKANSTNESANVLVTREWCIAINNINHISECLSTLASDLGFSRTINQITKLQGTERSAESIATVIDNTRDTQTNKIDKLATNMVEGMVSTIEASLDELTDLSQPDSDSMDRLMSFLENSLQLLNAELNSKIFNLMFYELWENIITKIGSVVRKGIVDVSYGCPF